MYLSRLVFDHRQREVRKDVADMNLLHKRVMKAFPEVEGDSPREQLGVLFRIDNNNGELVVLVQSKMEPDWSTLDGGLLRSEYKDIGPIYNKVVKEGAVFSFFLRGNPSVKKRFSEDENPKRIGLYKEEEQRDWLAKRRGGFEILSLTLIPEGMAATNERGLKFFSVMFQGVLRVTDSEAFRRTLECGIGSGKAFGFGMMSLGPVR